MKLACTVMVKGEASRGSVHVASGDSWRMSGILSHEGKKIMLLIAAAKSQSVREGYNWPVFMEVECVQSQS